MCPVAPPTSPVEPVTELLHGISVVDPYRWLEDQNSLQTRAWIEAQTRYARAYLDGIPGREEIRNRVRNLLDVETCDSFLKAGSRYFFRKRLPGCEQPSIYFRDGADGKDQLLVDPATRGSGDYTAVKPLRVSPDGSLLLYEVKQGGERMGMFEIVDVPDRRRLPDSLPRGYLRGFAFAPDGKSFYYAHERSESERPFYRAAYHHTIGTAFEKDREIFCAGEDERLRLILVSGPQQLGLVVYRFLEKPYTDFYLYAMGISRVPILILQNADYHFFPAVIPGRILAAVNHHAPNGRIVEVQARKNLNPLFFDLVPQTDGSLRHWSLTRNHILVSYADGAQSRVEIFDRFGKHLGRIPCDVDHTIRVIAANPDEDEILIERESFTEPIEVRRFSPSSLESSLWARRGVPLACGRYAHSSTKYPSKDGTSVPIFLFGRREVLAEGLHPVVMTSYGGYGIPITPQFSVFVSVLVEIGCLFALPSIRGGSEFGAEWHHAAKRRNRQVAFDDFLAAAEWLVKTGRTTPQRLAIFGGSNAGLLVGVAMTQRPDLFRAVLCVAPLLDMLRYHCFDGTHVWKDEFGTADEADDFGALASYSPYHAVRDDTAYPATMIVSGDADQNCNPLHARKMTARLQTANRSDHPVLLDYSKFRGHSPVLPFTKRLEALTDRLAFFAHQLELTP
jgi:prolyl oligopeptidase